MKRRDFVRGGLATGAAAVVSIEAARADARTQDGAQERAEPFRLHYAPHGGMFRESAGEDIVRQIEFAHDHGFTAWEDNTMTRRSVEEQERIAAALDRLGMKMGVFVANFGTAFGKKSFSTAAPEHLESFLADLRQSVEVAKRVRAKWMTIVLGDLEPRLDIEYQHANAIEMLERGAEVFEPHDLVMVMEPLNPRDHAGMLLSKTSQALMLCKAVGSPSLKILFDIYHQQITEGNLIPNIDRAWEEIAYFQIGDNPGRKEPGTGEVNYRNVFRHIHSKGFTGVMGMEHGNSRAGVEGEQAVIEAYRDADAF